LFSLSRHMANHNNACHPLHAIVGGNSCIAMICVRQLAGAQLASSRR
jgi:hypothetical protein